MVRVTFVEADSTRRTIKARIGEPLMIAARNIGLYGITAECCGSARCATCHCHVLEIPGGPCLNPSRMSRTPSNSTPKTRTTTAA